MEYHVQSTTEEQAVMDFRQSVIAELANPYLDHGERSRLIKEKASRTWDIPRTQKTSVSEATIKQWLSVYRRQGKEGLRPKRRSDSGNTRAVSDEEVRIFTEYLKEHPTLTASSAWNALKREGRLSLSISSSSLSRLVIAHGLRRDERLQAQVQGKSLKFDFFYPLECVQADCLHGPTIPGPGGKAVKAILIAFIDDATRRIVYAEFNTSEHSLAFEKGIRSILLSHGRIGRLYVDNGSTFVSLQTSRILDTLQIHLIHSTPHRPQGRGKIERFFRTVRDSFLRPLNVADIKGFDDLNLRFRTWLESEYHRNPHKGMEGHTPLESWLEKARFIKVLSPSIDLDTVFFHECHRRVAKDQTITINSILFEVPSVLIGKTVVLRYDPHRPRSTVAVWSEGKHYGECRLLDRYANTKVRRIQSTPSVAASPASTQLPPGPEQVTPAQASLVAAGLRRQDS